MTTTQQAKTPPTRDQSSATGTGQHGEARSAARHGSPQPDDRTGSVETARRAGRTRGKPPANNIDRSVDLVLRSDNPPVDQLDFDDRHDTRATQSTVMLDRYTALRRDRRRDEWHRLAMGLVALIVSVACYLASFIVMSQLLPHLSPWQVAQIVGLAYLAGGGGVAARWAGRALKQRHNRRPPSVTA